MSHPDEERVLAAATGLCGDRDRALTWYTGQPIDEFDGRTACELVNTGQADKALRYIETLDAGAAG